MLKTLFLLLLLIFKNFGWFPVDNDVRDVLQLNFVVSTTLEIMKAKLASTNGKIFAENYYKFLSQPVLTDKNFSYDFENLAKTQGLEKAIETTSYCLNKMFSYFFFYKITEAFYLFRDEENFKKTVNNEIYCENIIYLNNVIYGSKCKTDEQKTLSEYLWEKLNKTLENWNFFNKNEKFFLHKEINDFLLEIFNNLDSVGNSFFKDVIDKNTYQNINTNPLQMITRSLQKCLKIKKLGQEDFIEIIKNYRINMADLYKKNKEGGSMDQAMKNINGIMETTAKSLWSLIYESPEINQQFMDQWYKENFPTDEETNQDKTKEEKKLKELEKTSYKQQVFNNRRRMNEITDMIVKSGFIIIVIGGIGVACNKKYKFIDKIMVIYEEKFSFNKKMKNITRKQSKL